MAKPVLMAVAIATVLLQVSQPAYAQGACEASQLSRMQRDTKQFGEDVRDAGVTFAKEEMGEAAIAAGRELTRDSITSQKIFETRDQWNRWKEHVEKGRQVVTDTASCAPQYTSTCLLGLVKTELADEAEDFRRWVTSLAGEGFQAVGERVAKAGGLYRSYAERAFGMAQNSMESYLNNCATLAEQRIQARTNTSANGGAAAPKSGIGAGKLAAIAVTAVGSAAAIVYAGRVLEENERFLSEFGDINTPSSSPVPNNTPTTPAPPTGVRAFDGTYDFRITVTGPGGTESVRSLPQFLIINNGAVSTTQRDLTGTVSSTGRFIGVGVCPINSEPADYEGTMLANGTGSGTYRCRFGGISRGWQALNRR